MKGEIHPEVVEMDAPEQNTVHQIVADKEGLVFEVLAQMADHNSLDHTLPTQCELPKVQIEVSKVFSLG